MHRMTNVRRDAADLISDMRFFLFHLHKSAPAQYSALHELVTEWSGRPRTAEALFCDRP